MYKERGGCGYSPLRVRNAIWDWLDGNQKNFLRRQQNQFLVPSLTPSNEESANKVKSRKIMPGNQYIKTILYQAVWGAVKVRKSSFSKWFWSHQGHIGQKKAIIAVSRKLLKMIYILLETGQYYDPNYAVKATE